MKTGAYVFMSMWSATSFKCLSAVIEMDELGSGRDWAALSVSVSGHVRTSSGCLLAGEEQKQKQILNRKNHVYDYYYVLIWLTWTKHCRCFYSRQTEKIRLHLVTTASGWQSWPEENMTLSHNCAFATTSWCERIVELKEHHATKNNN